MNISKNIIIGVITTTSFLSTPPIFNTTHHTNYASQIQIGNSDLNSSYIIDNYIKESSYIYKPTYNSRDELLKIFGEVTDFTDDEQMIYNSILEKGAISTGVNLFEI